MADYAERRRIIIDANPGDFAKCLKLAESALDRTSPHIRGYWCSDDPHFEALVRINPHSVSVRGVRRIPDTQSNGGGNV